MLGEASRHHCEAQRSRVGERGDAARLQLATIVYMRQQFQDLAKHPPHHRGFLFEGLLKSTFDLFGMRARHSGPQTRRADRWQLRSDPSAQIPVSSVIEQKVRRAAETGRLLCVRKLFPD
ncbi:hypothetical protein [Mesorhizobium sp. M0768]|uniref:hypothetical protein n=1 Tax=Mesorhizobium sp. M0768 TaxID=2956996 RepID=UPI0033368E31